MNINHAIEYAAEHLPGGAEITLIIEKDAATISVMDWDGNCWDDFDPADKSLPDQIIECVEWAKRQPLTPNT